MSHLNEGSIQAYLDEELDAAGHAAVREHLAACDTCAADLASLKHAGMVAGNALSLLDTNVAAPVLQARAAIAAARRDSDAAVNRSAPAQAPSRVTAARITPRRFAAAGAAGFARAAMLLLALAGAGAAAIPGSPVRRALDATLERVAQLFSTQTPAEQVVDVPEPAPAADPVASEWAAIPPVDGRVSVQLHAPAGAVDVTVRLVEASRANVQTSMEEGEVRFVSGTGRLEVLGLGTGAVSIEIPRSLVSASIEVGGLVHVYKDGDVLRLTGPAGDAQGSEVRFRTGS